MSLLLFSSSGVKRCVEAQAWTKGQGDWIASPRGSHGLFIGLPIWYKNITFVLAKTIHSRIPVLTVVSTSSSGPPNDYRQRTRSFPSVHLLAVKYPEFRPLLDLVRPPFALHYKPAFSRGDPIVYFEGGLECIWLLPTLSREGPSVSPAPKLIISYFALFTHELTIWKSMYHNIKEVQITFYFAHHLFVRHWRIDVGRDSPTYSRYSDVSNASAYELHKLKTVFPLVYRLLLNIVYLSIVSIVSINI